MAASPASLASLAPPPPAALNCLALLLALRPPIAAATASAGPSRRFPSPHFLLIPRFPFLLLPPPGRDDGAAVRERGVAGQDARDLLVRARPTAANANANATDASRSRALVTLMCRSVSWGRGERRLAPVLVIARHPLLGGTIELPLADLTCKLSLRRPSPRMQRRRVWEIALGASRRTISLRAASDAQYDKWTRLTREWLQLGHDLTASVVSASPTATSDTTSLQHQHRRRRLSFLMGKQRSKTSANTRANRVDLTPVPWTLDMLPSPLASSISPSTPSQSPQEIEAKSDSPLLERKSNHAQLETDDVAGCASALESEQDHKQPSHSVFSLLQVLKAQDASLETISSARSSGDAISIAPLSEVINTREGEFTSRDTATSSAAAFSIGDSAPSSSSSSNSDSSTTAREWTHPTGRNLSSMSLSSWLSESDLEDRRPSRLSSTHQQQHQGRRRASSEDGRSSSFDYEQAFPWIFHNAAERRVIVITRQRANAGGPQTVYFF